jgi:hypothetical protein
MTGMLSQVSAAFQPGLFLRLPSGKEDFACPDRRLTEPSPATDVIQAIALRDKKARRAD